GAGGLGDLLSPAGAVAAVLGAAVMAGAAALLVRRPTLAPLAVLVAAPFRPPIEFDAGSSVLVTIARDGALGRLLPLYFVLVACVLALAWRVLRGERVRELPRAITRPAAAFFAFACLSLAWAEDLEAAANLLVFFTLPFALLLVVVARSPVPPGLTRRLGIAGVALAVLFAAVGLWQAATQKLFFFAPNLQVSNANTDYFRVTSLFGDPSLYGRHLVLGIAVLLAVLAAGRVRPWLGIGLLAFLWAGLLFSYSQSSMVALVVITLAVAAASGDRRTRQAVVALGVAAVLLGSGFLAVKLVTGSSLNQLTSDREQRVADTARVIKDHPVIGVGVAGQPRASRLAARSERPTASFVSHTTPLTVAAELGVVGLALYGWLLLGGVRSIVEVRRRDEGLGLALGAAFVALFVHALFYSGFLEDPLTWVVLGVTAGWLASAAARATPAERARERSRRVAHERSPART
ncbi:MAG TPA: O-antigen ligase family protein, partial [Vicinamibacteria bacterium]